MLQRKNSNKENLPPLPCKKQKNCAKPNKMKSSAKNSKSPSLGKIRTSKDAHRCTQRELSNLKCEVRKMRKEVELFKTYYLTQASSYRSIEESQTREQYHPLEGIVRGRSASKEQEYLINGSQSFSNRDQSQYYIQYYLQN